MILNNRTQLIEERLNYYEKLSKEMTMELKNAIAEITQFNGQIVALLNKQDTRLELLTTNLRTRDEEYKKLEQKVVEYRNERQTELDNVRQELIEIRRYKDIATFVISGIVVILGILASAGWLSPPSKTQVIYQSPPTLPK